MYEAIRQSGLRLVQLILNKTVGKKHQYTCQLTCILPVSQACRLKTSITRIQGNFTSMTHNSGLL